MSQQELPRDFDSDDEIAEWFDNVDLSAHELERALDVELAAHVQLVLEEDLTPPASTGVATGETHYDFEPVHS
jgi:hypothetical protein